MLVRVSQMGVIRGYLPDLRLWRVMRMMLRLLLLLLLLLVVMLLRGGCGGGEQGGQVRCVRLLQLGQVGSVDLGGGAGAPGDVQFGDGAETRARKKNKSQHDLKLAPNGRCKFYSPILLSLISPKSANRERIKYCL